MVEQEDRENASDDSESEVEQPEHNAFVVVCFVQKGVVQNQTQTKATPPCQHSQAESSQLSQYQAHDARKEEEQTKDEPSQPLLGVSCEEHTEDEQGRQHQAHHCPHDEDRRLKQRLPKHSHHDPTHNENNPEQV